MPAVAPAQGCRLGITLPTPPLTPAVLAYPATSRKPYNVILLDRCNKTARVVSKYNLRPLPVLSCSRSSLGSHQEPNSFFSRGPGSLISAASSAFSGGNQGGMFNKSPTLPCKRRFSIQARAQKSNSGSLRHPALTEKPEWWWRTLACVPYLISLQISDTGFYIQPLLEHYECFEDLIYYIPGAVKRLPMWFPMLYCYLSYIHVVKKKEWPIFLRYNVMMAMLLETGLQIVWHSSNFMPLIHFNGPFGMYYWAAVGFIYIFILLECIRCALGGRFVRIPFVTEAALFHSLYHVGGFQRPF